MRQVLTYPAPGGAALRRDYVIKVRTQGGEWQNVDVYEVKVDMHDVRESSMASIDMEGEIEVWITYCLGELKDAVIRPLSYGLMPDLEGQYIRFLLDRPRKLVIECNGDRFGCLHLFANEIEREVPNPANANVIAIRPGIHRIPDILRLVTTAGDDGKEPDTFYFEPGMHYLEETVLPIPSNKTVYIAGGAVVVGSLVCERVYNVHIRGRGLLYLADFHRFSAFRGVRIVFSSNVTVEGITVVDPPHYSIFLGKSSEISIRNFKAFSTRGWSDGIDMMACEQVSIDDVFMRNSDDCIAVYGSRWDFRGSSRNITVFNSVLWADVAHPINIGTHGDHAADGDCIEALTFCNIDILEHHEPQRNYWGAMSINAGDHNVVRDVLFERIRVEHIEEGQLFDVRVVHNKDYNPVPGSRIENVVFRDIDYAGGTLNPSRIHGFDEERSIDGIALERVRIGETLIDRIDHPQLDINGFVHPVRIV